MVYAFFASHWILSVFFQSFFLHRYSAHRMYTMSPRVERLMHLLTYLMQGASYLSPRGYAILHRQHHAFSDTPQDPHAPSNYRNVFTMMWDTKHRYDRYAYRREEPEARFLGGYPEWNFIDHTLGQSWVMRTLWGVAYFAFYAAFMTSRWQLLLFPLHLVMGPLHGAIVNWCGHMNGYRNHDTPDRSRNTLPIDIVTMGELFQNNHHQYGQRPNFANKWFELDPTWQVMRVLTALRVIKLSVPVTAHEGSLAASA
jgi:stearoyl-CoA desaturase (Delta-9 desaturase)